MQTGEIDTPNIFAGFAFQDGMLEYNEPENWVWNNNYPHLDEAAFRQAVELISSQISEMARAYINKENNYYFDVIAILNFVDDAINCFEKFISYRQKPSKRQTKYDMVFDDLNPDYQRYIDIVYDLTYADKHEGMYDVNADHIPRLYLNCFDLKCQHLQLFGVISKDGQIETGIENPAVILSDGALIEIKDITKGLIVEAIKAVATKTVGMANEQTNYCHTILYERYADRFTTSLPNVEQLEAPQPNISPNPSPTVLERTPSQLSDEEKPEQYLME
jgi:hypothetical protein